VNPVLVDEMKNNFSLKKSENKYLESMIFDHLLQFSKHFLLFLLITESAIKEKSSLIRLTIIEI